MPDFQVILSSRKNGKRGCLVCGRTPQEERRDPGPCWRRKRHVWGPTAP